MADPLPPDPYEALGVGKEATAAAIKTQYRKLALKFHPDKVKDDAAKGEASDKFHKIQSAWEIVGDEARRARYDASIKLHELRKDVFAAQGGHGARRSGDADVRTASYKMPPESARGGDFYARGPDRYGPKVSPQYEERRPSYGSDEYYEEPSRPTSRKYEDYERSTPKRAPPREDRERTRAKDAKENERSSRKEKSRRTDKDVRRDRERKQAYVEVQEEYDVSDEYDRAQRTPPDDDHLQRARADFFATREGSQAREPAGNYDDRSRKTFQHLEEAKAHMERQRAANRGRGESESRNLSPGNRRPSPVRMPSSKEKVKRAETKGGFFSGVRHGSGERPKSSRTKTDKEQKSSDEDRKNSRRKEEPRDSKQPSLKQSKSTPPVTETRPPFNRQRSHSMQDEQHVEEQMPTFKRAETMPQSPTAAAPPRTTRPRDNSRLHPDSASYPTPEPTPEAEPVKFRYGKDQTYADDGAFIPTPDGYVEADAEPFRTQEYVPSRETARQSTRESGRTARYTRSPEPIKDGERQGRRSSSARHTSSQKPSMPRTTSTQYIVEPEGGSYVRPAPSRENSGREQMRTMSRENSGRGPQLFGEVRTPSGGARSGSPRQHYSFPPPADDNVKYSRRYNDADIKVQSGYSRRQDEKPSYTRSGSGLHRAQTAVYA